MKERDVQDIRKDLEKTLSDIEEQLKEIDMKREERLYARFLFEKGRALRNLSLISSGKEEKLRSSIECLTESMNLHNRENDIHGSSRVHFELGLAYLELGRVSGDENNRDIAIRAFDEAREILTYDDDPELYNRIENALKEAWRY